MNVTVLIGNLTRDPELQYTQTGKAVCNFTLAVNRSYGEKQADFINIIVWEKQAENVAKYLAKGSKAAVMGRLQVQVFDNSEGVRVYKTEVIADRVDFLGSKKDSPKDKTASPPSYGEEVPLSSDPLPF